MAAQGQDPTEIVEKVAKVIKLRQKNYTIEDAIEEVFQPKNPPAGSIESVEQPSVPSAPGAPAGGLETPEEEALEGPGIVQQRPELQSLLSSLSASGKVGSSVRTINRRVVG